MVKRRFYVTKKLTRVTVIINPLTNIDFNWLYPVIKWGTKRKKCSIQISVHCIQDPLVTVNNTSKCPPNTFSFGYFKTNWVISFFQDSIYSLHGLAIVNSKISFYFKFVVLQHMPWPVMVITYNFFPEKKGYSFAVSDPWFGWWFHFFILFFYFMIQCFKKK